MVLLNPRGHGYNDKFDEIIEQLDFMDNCEQKNNVQQIGIFCVIALYSWSGYWIASNGWGGEDSQHKVFDV